MKKPPSFDFSFQIKRWPDPSKWQDEDTDQSGIDWLIAGLSVFLLFGLLWSVLMTLVNDAEEI